MVRAAGLEPTTYRMSSWLAYYSSTISESEFTLMAPALPLSYAAIGLEAATGFEPAT